MTFFDEWHIMSESDLLCSPVVITSVENDQVRICVEGKSWDLTQLQRTLWPSWDLFQMEVYNTDKYTNAHTHTHKDPCIIPTEMNKKVEKNPQNLKIKILGSVPLSRSAPKANIVYLVLVLSCF